MVMRWPGGIRAKGEIRSQFHHVVDVAPTALEAAKLPQPKSVNGVAQRPMDGVSMLYSADAPKAADRRTTQYFEMFGNRAIYHDGWVASTRHSIPWLMVPLPAVKDDVWELYHVEKDFSQANNLAAKEPAKLAELQAIFLKEAVRNHVLPIDDRRSERFNPAIAGRPDLLGGRKSLTVYPGMTGMLENAFINVKGVHHTVTAEVELADASTDGVILAQAGYFGGWVLYMKDGKPHHEYNFFALERTNIAGESAARTREAHDSLRVHPRRRETRHGRQIDSLRGRPAGRLGPDSEDPAVRVLGGRGRGRGPRRRDQRFTRLHARQQRLHRQDRQSDGGAEVECCADSP